jgi:hypothetical protein
MINLFHCEIPAMMICLVTAQKQQSCRPWTKTSETMSQNIPFLLINQLSQVFYHNDKKLAKTDVLGKQQKCNTILKLKIVVNPQCYLRTNHFTFHNFSLFLDQANNFFINKGCICTLDLFNNLAIL